MKCIVSGLNSNETARVKELWKQYNIKMAIENIGTAWDKVTWKTMNGAWKKLFSNYVHDFEGVEVTVRNIGKDIVDLSNKIGFEGVDNNNVEDLLQLHNEELTNEELIQLDAHLSQEEQEKEDEMPPKTFDMKKLEKLFAAVDAVTTILDENDPNLERSRQM
jgi:hypothetical protein